MAYPIKSKQLQKMSMLHIMAPIEKGKEAAFQEFLDEIDGRIQRQEMTALKGVATLHFLTLDIVKPDPKVDQSYFVFVAVFDGQIEDYAALTLEAFPKRIYQAWEHCVGYPGPPVTKGFPDYDAFMKYVGDFSYVPTVFYAANPTVAAVDVARLAQSS